jgi:hypothetical protein
MRFLLFTVITICAPAISLVAQADMHNRGPVSDEIERMAQQIAGVRTMVSGAIADEARPRSKPDLPGLIRTLSNATNQLAKDRIEVRASAAEKAIRQAALTASRFDSSHSPDMEFDPAPLLQELNSLRGECSALRERISQVNVTAAQLNGWVGIMKGILAEKDLRAKLHGRLDEVLHDWNNPALRCSTTNQSNSTGGNGILPRELSPENPPLLPAKAIEEAPEGKVVAPILPAGAVNRQMVAPATPPLVGTFIVPMYSASVPLVQQPYSYPVLYPRPYGAPVVYVIRQRPMYRVIPPTPVYYGRSRFYR